MAIQNRETDPGPDDSISTPNGPGKGPMGVGWIVAVAIYLVFASVFVLYGLIKLWPYPTPSGELDAKVEEQADTSRASTNTATPGGTSTQNDAAIPTSQTTVTPNVAGRSDPGTAGALASTPPQTTPARTSPSSAPTPARKLPDPEVISFFNGRFKANIYLETRLLLLVMLAGALGSLMHSLRSLYWYTGNRMMVWSWVGFYVLLPFTGAMLSVIFYFVVRGGFFSPQASFENTSPFGFAALSALVGLFSPQATLKLKEVAETIFTKPPAGADPKPQEASPQSEAGGAATAPTISSITPVSGSAAGAEKVVVAGKGFAQGVVVKFGGVPAEVTSALDTTIEVVTPTALAAGLVDVEITNADGGKATLSQGFTYLAAHPVDSRAAGGASDETPVHGEGGDEDLIDGCEVEFKTDTADEELPITEGGVK